MLLSLVNPIQNYAWGSTTAISQLLGHPSPSDEPEAELWLGAHPKAPSYVRLEGDSFDLRALLRDRPLETLGPRCAERFGELPFLMKLLAAERALSIQAHPTAAQARAGFAREKAAGIPITATNRNYRDTNHKPEIICALTPMTALCGFRAPTEISELLAAACPESLAPERRQLAATHDLQQLLVSLLNLPDDRRPPLFAELRRAADTNAPTPMIAAWLRRLADQHPADVGIAAPLFLNLVTLQPNEALATEAGVLHAYLDGFGVELMANSDNVLRGGLTRKHVDVPELVRCLDFTPRPPGIPETTTLGPETRYHTAAAEFQLSRLELAGDPLDLRPDGPEILICTAGAATATETTRPDAPTVRLPRGSSFFVAANTKSYRLTGNATLFRASVPAP